MARSFAPLANRLPARPWLSLRTELPLAAVLSLAGLSLAGCEGPLKDIIPPFVTTTSPSDGSTGVSIDAAFVVNFSEALDPGSVTSETVKMQTSNGGAVPTTLTHDGSRVTLKPNATALPDQGYQVVLSSGIKDKAGNTLLAAGTYRFTTGHRRWQDRSPFGSFAPEPTQMVSGFANTVFLTYEGSTQLVVNKMNLATDNFVPFYGAETIDSTTGPGLIMGASIAADAAGNAMIAYLKSTAGSPGSFNLYARYYRASSGTWDSVTLLENLAGNPELTHVLFDSSGNAHVFWAHNPSGTGQTIYGAKFTPGGGGSWGGGVVNYSSAIPASTTVLKIKSAASADGTALLVFSNFSGVGTGRLDTLRFNGSTWVAGGLASAYTGSITDFSVSTDASGNFGVGSIQKTSSSVFTTHLMGSRFAKSGGGGSWSFQTLTSSATGDVAGTQVRSLSDASGNIMIVALQFTVTSAPQESGLYVYSYRPAGLSGTPGWSVNPYLISTASFVSDVEVGMDASGRFLATWVENPNTFWDENLVSSSYTPGEGWSGQATPVQNLTPALVSTPRFAVTPGGMAIASWHNTYPHGTGEAFYSIYR